MKKSLRLWRGIRRLLVPAGVKSLILTVAVLLLFFSKPLYSDDCPPGSVAVRVERSGDEERTYCKCQPGYVARHGQCVLSMPVVDPAAFVSPEQVAFLELEMDRLTARKARLSREMDKLNLLRENEDGYLQELGEMREQLVYDSVSDMLSIVSAGEFLSRVPNLKPQEAARLGQALKLMKADVDAVAAALAGKNRDRARDKATTAVGGVLSLVAQLSLPESEKEAFSTAIKVSAETLKAVDPNRKPDTGPLRDRVAAAMDRFAGVLGVDYQPVGLARAAVHAGGSAIVIWHIQTDKEAIQDALVSSQRAKLAVDQRLAATEELMNFYQMELKKAGK